MSDDANTYSFDPSTVSRLFQLCDAAEQDEAPRQPDREKNCLIRDLLAEVPPLNEDVLAGVPELLRRLHETSPRVQGRSLGRILQDSESSLAELRSVKEYAKALVSKAINEIEHEAAGVIYYAAIARALLSHNVSISQHSRRQLAESFSTLLADEWIPPDIRDLFAQAKEACAHQDPEQPTST